MATVDVDLANPASIPQDVTDEARVLASLARLQEMHIQLRQLRETIPSLMHAVHAEHSSPEALYADISQTAVRSVQDIKSFTSYIAESENQDVLARARKSRAKSREGITSWLVTQHPHWLDRNTGGGVKELVFEKDGADGLEKAGKFTLEDVTMIVNKFKEANAGVGAVVNKEAESLNVSLPPPARLSFNINLKPHSSAAEIYKVSSSGTSNLHAGILSAVAKRPLPNDLVALLNMLSSYSDIKTRPCQKCHRLLDTNAQFPVVRTVDHMKLTTDEEARPWKALHTGCYTKGP